MASRSRSEGGGATSGEGADAIGGAFRHVAQSLQEALQMQAQEAERRLQEVLRLQEERAQGQLQEALRLQEQEASRRLQEAIARLEQQLQQKDTAISALQQRLDAQEYARASEGPGGEGARVRLEGRMEKFEASLQRAMRTFFPMVEALMRQLEQSPPPGTPSGSTSTSTASTSTSASASTSDSVSTSASISASSDSRARAVGEQASGARGESPTGRLNAAEEEDEQRQRERVERWVREVEERSERSRAAPCPLGEVFCKAAQEGRLEQVRWLLDSGANVNYTDRNGLTALTYVTLLNPQAAVLSLLMERGADVNAVNIYESSALHLAAYNDLSGRCVELLVDAGADVNARRVDGLTPLHCAAQKNNEAAVRALLAAGARRELRGWSGMWENETPLDVATSPAVRELLRR